MARARPAGDRRIARLRWRVRMEPREWVGGVPAAAMYANEDLAGIWAPGWDPRLPTTASVASARRPGLFGEEEAHAGRGGLVLVLQPLVERGPVGARHLVADLGEELLGPPDPLVRSLHQYVELARRTSEGRRVPDLLALPGDLVVGERRVELRLLGGEHREQGPGHRGSDGPVLLRFPPASDPERRTGFQDLRVVEPHDVRVAPLGRGDPVGQELEGDHLEDRR